MTIIYKILSIILNMAGIFLAICLLVSIPLLLASPLNMLSAFMLVCIVLYAFFSARFQRQVLQRQQVVKPSLRDWIRVNGFVSLFYSVVIILGMLMYLKQPQPLTERLQQMQINVPASTVTTMLTGLLVFGIVLLVHILWTLALVRKNREYFQT